jgi:hypothetical protein
MSGTVGLDIDVDARDAGSCAAMTGAVDPATTVVRTRAACVDAGPPRGAIGVTTDALAGEVVTTGAVARAVASVAAAGNDPTTAAFAITGVADAEVSDGKAEAAGMDGGALEGGILEIAATSGPIGADGPTKLICDTSVSSSACSLACREREPDFGGAAVFDIIGAIG